MDPCQQLVFLRIQINTMTGRLTLKPEKLPELCMWLTTHLPTMGAGITQPTGIFGGKIVLGQPRRALGSHPPHLNICVNFIPKVTNPQVPPWWLTDGSDLVALLAHQWGKLATYLVPTTALYVFTDACTDGGGGICCGNLLYAHWAHDVPRLTPHHAFTLHCTIPPPPPPPPPPMWVLSRIDEQQLHFLATLLIMVIEIRLNFQIYGQCVEKAISEITFNIQWNLKQIWHLWHTWLSKYNIKGFENNGVWVTWSVQKDRVGQRDQGWAGADVGPGVVWVTGLFDINTKELATAVIAAQVWSHAWANYHVVEFTDNRMTEAAVNNGTARNGTCLHLLKHFAALALQFNFNISAVYIPGDDSTITDRISRLHEPGKLLSSLLNVLVSYLLHNVNISAKFRPFLFQGFPRAQPYCN